MKTIYTLILLASIQQVAAQDRFFAYTYTSDVLNKGSFDMELWHTSRFGHSDGLYHAMDQRMELEAGLGGRTQTAVYFNRYQVTKSDSAGNISHSNEIGISNEWKWRMTNGYTHAIGSALYAEVGIKGDEIELETKIILDKTFGRHLFALNLVSEISNELSKENNKFRYHIAQTPVEIDLGYLYNISKDFGVGLELKNANDIEKGNWKNSVLFGGPTLNYRTERWFLIASYLPQIINIHKTKDFPFNKVLDEHERNEARIIIGFSF